MPRRREWSAPPQIDVQKEEMRWKEAQEVLMVLKASDFNFGARGVTQPMLLSLLKVLNKPDWKPADSKKPALVSLVEEQLGGPGAPHFDGVALKVARGQPLVTVEATVVADGDGNEDGAEEESNSDDE